MTYDDYITQEGVSLPITGFEDLVFDYLEHLNEKEHFDIPIEEIITAIVTAQELIPHVAELNENYIVEYALPIQGDERVH